MKNVVDIIRRQGLCYHRPAAIRGGPSSFKDLIEDSFNKNGTKTAILHGERSVTYKELQEASYRVADALLKIGIEKGDPIAISMPNSIDIIETFLGVMQIGAIWVGLNMHLSLPEKIKMLEETEAKLFIGDRNTISVFEKSKLRFTHTMGMISIDHEDNASEWKKKIDNSSLSKPDIEIDPYAPAAIAFTSGTTGSPKGAVHSQHNLLLCAKIIRLEHLKGSVLGIVLPLTILNIMVHGPVCAFVDASMASIFNDISTSEIVRQVKENKVACFGGFVPALVYDLIKDHDIKKEDMNNLLHASAGGASCTDELKKAYKSRFNQRLFSGYGLTEAPGAVVLEQKNKSAVKGATGQPLLHIKLHILDDGNTPVPAGAPGEICIGPQTEGEWAGVYSPMLGYWNNLELTQKVLKGNVLHTGDIGKIDEEGNLYVLERKDDMIIRGGNNIYPAEIEDALMRHPEIECCSVFGKPHERLGQTIISCVELKAGSNLDENAIKEYLSECLAKYKIPEDIRFMKDMPKNSMGKVMKGNLKIELLVNSRDPTRKEIINNQVN